MELIERYRGAMLGLAVGDAIGTTVEFSPRGSFAPLTDMVGGGPFNLAAGQWTDDTSMALCLAESLVICKGFNAQDQMNRYLNWYRWGHRSATGHCFDIGVTTARALERFSVSGNPFAGSADPSTAGNGSLMRLAPIPLYYLPSIEETLHFAAESSRTTHAAPEAVDCCRLFAAILHHVLRGERKDRLIESCAGLSLAGKVGRMVNPALVTKSEKEIAGSAYCVESLEAALWCFLTTGDYASAVLRAANLGDDADTTAAITGQLAGAYYGERGIPERWRERVTYREDIESLADELYGAANPG